jgi:hypothetical protein
MARPWRGPVVLLLLLAVALIVQQCHAFQVREMIMMMMIVIMIGVCRHLIHLHTALL